MLSFFVRIDRTVQHYSALCMAAFLFLAGLLLLGKFNGIANAAPCSGQRPTPGNACGVLTVCKTAGNCTTWFTPAAGLSKLTAGLATDNWVAGAQTPCGNGGNCQVQAGMCIQLNGAAKTTSSLVDDGECSVG
jgi:hypothetical protein